MIVSNSKSDSKPERDGVPLSLMMGSVLFALFMRPLNSILARLIDDSKFYVTYFPGDIDEKFQRFIIVFIA